MVKKIEQQRDDLIGVDVGGTFTDIIRFDQKREKFCSPKFQVQKIRPLA